MAVALHVLLRDMCSTSRVVCAYRGVPAFHDRLIESENKIKFVAAAQAFLLTT